MAVNVKQLRIGSHILVDGKRERVRGLDEDNGVIVRFPAEYVNANDVEPIAITPGLLEELGFVGNASKQNAVYGWEKRDEDIYIAFDRITEQRWRLIMYDNVVNNGNTLCRYLHEAEAFLALHGVELIKERQ